MSRGFVEVEIKGGRQMAELFKQLPEALGQKVLRKALMKSAQPLLQELKSRTPVANHGSGSNRTGGELQRSMKARYGRKQQPESATVLVGTKLHYAWFLEKGTEFQQPTHFATRSFYATVDNCISTFTEVCSESLDAAIESYALKRGTR